jgi:hypothetical protein
MSCCRGTVDVPTRAHLSLCLAVTAAVLGCAARVPHTEPAPIIQRSYVDLQPGWRIRTVTPVLKSGKYKPEFKETAVAGGMPELSAGDDFLGYETSCYAVTPGSNSGVEVVFVSAETTINGEASRQPEPRVRLFDFSASAQYVRLVFLTRVSRADHNQAILAASDMPALDNLTRQVEADPAANCKSQGENYCMWVPEGTAVRPEKRDPAHRKHWIPAT